MGPTSILPPQPFPILYLSGRTADVGGRALLLIRGVSSVDRTGKSFPEFPLPIVYVWLRGKDPLDAVLGAPAFLMDVEGVLTTAPSAREIK